VAAFHVAPPSALVITKAENWLWSVPTATHAVAVGQLMAVRGPAAAGTARPFHVAPPSLLVAICAPEKSGVAPAAMHEVVVGHATPTRGPMGA
jgi:hypothetical protein